MVDPHTDGSSVGCVLRCLCRDPVRYLARRWNWKSAVLSSLLRSSLFSIANIGAGLPAARSAFLTELLFRATTAGFYGALTQAFRDVRPVWTGLDRDALADVLANADVFIHPNPREPFGIAPIEAMASGLPLVAPTTGGVTTYASDETAWLAPAEPEDFARCVRQIFAQPDVRARKIQRALVVARGYRWKRVAGQFFDTYEQLVNRRSCERFSAPVIAAS